MKDATAEMGVGEVAPDDLKRLAAGLLMVGFPGPTVPRETVELIRQGVRAFIFFDRNIGDADGVTALTAALRALAGADALVAIDHEGGRVNRLERVVTPWPSPMAWAATGDVGLARRASTEAARELASLGFNLNFAPVADLLGDHRNPVLGVRCFSDDPRTAADFTTAFIEGHRSARMATTAKHFPGHGGTSVDSHVDMPEIALTREELERSDLIPFRAAVAAAVDCLMVSHIWYSALDERATPASVSRSVMELARNELGYDGVIVTDCMEMGAIQNHMTTSEAVVAAIGAGADLAIVSHRIDRQREALDALVDAVTSGAIPLTRVLDAHRRLDALRKRVKPAAGTGTGAGAELAQDIARRSITLVRDEREVLPLQPGASELLGVVTFVPCRPTGVENDRAPQSELSAVARQHGVQTIGVQVGDLTPEDVLEALKEADTVLIGTSFATGRPVQRGVVDALLRTGKQVVVLALDDPFDLLAFPDVPCYLAAYGDTRRQIDAALGVLFGTLEPHGRLPVQLGDLYPRQHGLTTPHG